MRTFSLLLGIVAAAWAVCAFALAATSTGNQVRILIFLQSAALSTLAAGCFLRAVKRT